MARSSRKLAATLAALTLAGGSLALAGCGGDDDDASTTAAAGGSTLSGTMAGAGASSQAAAMEAWIAGFQTANSGVTVSYDPIGSGGGREQFSAGGTLFGGTDSAFSGAELAKAQDRCGGPDNLIQIPGYVSPIAIAYNLPGVENLQLSPETLARVLKREITSWDDPAIAADNPDTELPGGAITVVNRSDESGTTENLQEYLAAVAPDVWDFEVDGNWPVKGGEAATGTSGVVAAIRAGEGTIGYADASQVGDLGKVQVGVGDSFVGPSADAAAAILDASERSDEGGANSFTYELARDTESAGTYPIVLVSYSMACTEYGNAKDAALVKGFLSHVISPEGQDAAASAAGSAPISDSLRELVKPAVDSIGG